MDREDLLRMREQMLHRGPDGAGLWVSPDGLCGLVHRRLAIIDLSEAGAQPMLDPETGNAVVFNGEIYNYLALRAELEARGAVFRSRSDTEVLLHLWRIFGEKMVERLRGMFAFALWDARERRLFLARDPLGIKPLYLAEDGKTLRFASQVRALIAGGVPAEPSAAGMAGFFLWGHVPEPWTWAEAVKALPAGSILSVSIDGPVPKPHRYFDLREEILRAEEQGTQAKELLPEVLDALADSVRHHLVADVPVGVFLSAGRDSNLIAALASKETAEPLRTLTLAFEEYRGTLQDESPWAERSARILETRHTTSWVTGEDFEAQCERLFAAMDQPTIDGVNTWFVSRAAAQTGLKVALSGLGGDELFGGYPSFRQVPRVAQALRAFGAVPWLGKGVRVAATPLVRRVASPKWASLFEYGHSLPGVYLLRRALFLPWELPSVMDAEVARRGLEELDPLGGLAARIRGVRDPAMAVMALEMTCYMRSQLLRDADWAGMAHSLEIRVPLVDAYLLRRWLPLAAGRLPFDRAKLLEHALPALAAHLAGRPKTGFGIPVEIWLQRATSARSRSHATRRLRPWARRLAREFAPAIESFQRPPH